jgi:hypothetical protein
LRRFPIRRIIRSESHLPDFDMALWQFELEPIPAAAATIDGLPAIHLDAEARDAIEIRLERIERDALVQAIGALLPAAETWSAGLLVWGSTRGTDVQLYLDDDGIALKIRIDAQSFTHELIEAFCDLAVEFDWVFLTDRGTVLHPNPDTVLRALLRSSARRFVENPHAEISKAVAEMGEPG